MEIIMNRERNSKEIMEEIARDKVKKMKKFYDHLFIFTIGVVIYILKTYFGLPFNFWPIRFINEFFMWCWTFIIAVQGIKLFFTQNLLGRKWEEQKIKEILEEEKVNKQNWE